MNTPPLPLTDERLSRALEDLAGHADSLTLMSDVMAAVDATPQVRRRSWWTAPAPSLSLASVAVLAMVGLALAGAIAVGTGILRLPWNVTIPAVTANGEIAVATDGCQMIGVDPGSPSDTHVLFEGFPHCYSRAASFDSAWSPDGTTLAVAYGYFCGGCASAEAVAAIENEVAGVWFVVPETGMMRQVATCWPGCPTSAPRWSPDGSRIAFTREGSASATQTLWVATVGGDAVRIGDAATRPITGLAWSPDGSRIAVARSRTGSNSVSIAPADGGEETTILELGRLIDSIDWSPDGDSLLITSTDRIGLLALDHVGTGTLMDWTETLYVAPAGSEVTGATWSPDGMRFAFVRAEAEEVDDSGAGPTHVEYLTFAADGSDPTVAYAVDRLVDGWTRAAWSPDGTSLVFAIHTARGQSSTYTVGADGADPTLVVHLPPWDVQTTAGTPQAPAWRPIQGSRVGTP